MKYFGTNRSLNRLVLIYNIKNSSSLQMMMPFLFIIDSKWP